MSNEKQWKSGSAEIHMVETRHPPMGGGRSYDRDKTERNISSYLAAFLQANLMLPGEVIITGRHETSGGYITLYLSVYTKAEQSEMKTVGGFPFKLAA